MRPKTSTDLSLNNRFHLGKFEKSISADQKYGIIIKTSPFTKAFLLEKISPFAESCSIFVTPGKTRTPIKYIDNKQRLVSLLWIAYDLYLLEHLQKSGFNPFPEIYKVYDQTRNYFLMPLRIWKEEKWSVGTSPAYQLTYFGVPTIAVTWDIWQQLSGIFGKWIHSFQYLEYDYESKQARRVYVSQFTYLVEKCKDIILEDRDGD